MTVQLDAGPLVASLDAAADELRDPTDLHKTAAGEVDRLAAPPRRTGRLIASQTSTVEDGAGIVRWGVGYAVYVNFGTRRMRAQPFATGALARAEESITRAALAYVTGVTAGVHA